MNFKKLSARVDLGSENMTNARGLPLSDDSGIQSLSLCLSNLLLAHLVSFCCLQVALQNQHTVILNTVSISQCKKEESELDRVRQL